MEKGTVGPTDDQLVIRAIGHIGRWQVEKALLLGLCLVPTAWHYLSYPLLTKEKPFYCLSANSTIDGDPCMTTSGPCTEWSFQQDGSVTLQEDFNLVCDRERLLPLRQTLFFLGMLVGCLASGYVSDKFGRKLTMLALMACWSAAALLHVIVPNYSAFLTLQFILALSAQSSWTTAWIWTMECVGGSDRWRAILGLGTFVFWAIGFMSSAGIVYLLPNWRHSFLVMGLPTLLFALYAWLIPESPLWLISKGRMTEAETILADAARKNGMVPMENLASVAQKEAQIFHDTDQEEDAGIYWSLFATKNLRTRTFVLCALFFVASFLYYGLALNSGGIGGDHNLFLTFTLYGAMELPALLFAIVSLLTLGRRLPTVLLFLFAGLSCIGAACVSSEALKIALAVFGKLCITACFHTLFVYTSEMYATPNRNTGLAICSVFARVAGMVAPYVVDLETIHPFLPIAVYGGCGVLASLFATLLPETKGYKLPQTLAESENFGDGDTLWTATCTCKK